MRARSNAVSGYVYLCGYVIKRQGCCHVFINSNNVCRRGIVKYSRSKLFVCMCACVCRNNCALAPVSLNPSAVEV